ncbi:hypothetical protein ACL02U_11975 [Streptomyces sp. MS06]|uniref:hypothetical protein n=1 Tax=Streptomyces sp. MS06 TaxID=3385974 RepID=UPI0039A11FA0
MVSVTRYPLTGHARYRVEKAREELSRAQQLDLSDGREMARTIGRLEVALSQLLDVIDECSEVES